MDTRSARYHAAEILGPWMILSTTRNYMTDLALAQFLHPVDTCENAITTRKKRDRNSRATSKCSLTNMP